MKQTNKDNSVTYLVTIGVVVALFLIVVIIRAPDLMNRKGADGTPEGTDPAPLLASPSQASTPEASPSVVAASTEPVTVAEPESTPKQNPIVKATRELLAPRRNNEIKLQDVVKNALTWMPVEAHESWFGRPAPDFTVVDIDGKQHKLSDYKGRQVVLALWSPSFPPSVTELKTFSQLRAEVPAEELVLLGVSFDDEERVKRTVRDQPAINYPIVAAGTQAMPAPYSTQRPVPGAIFIETDGTFKISVHGPIPLDEIKRVLRAG